MDDRSLLIARRRLAHGGAPYPPRPARARPRLVGRPALFLGLVLLLAAPPALAAPVAREIKADGAWHAFEVKTPEQVLRFLFEATAGCRYRLQVESRTLPRILLEVGPGEATVWRADSRPPDDRPPTTPPPKRPRAEVDWYAETDGVLEARVRGFSAMTGRGRLRLQTLGPDARPVKAHRRLLAPGGTLAQVGSLWVGDADSWELVVEPGRTYEAKTRPGTAGRIHVAVVGPEGTVVASVDPSVERPYPSVVFRVPDAVEGAPTAAYRLEVRSVDGSGGTYGVRLQAAPPGLGPDVPASEPEPERVESGILDDRPLTFRANPGDLAVLYLKESSATNPHWLYRQDEDGRWKALPHDAVSLYGERASMRTPESAALVWFRAFRSATYRFVERRPKQAILKLYEAKDVPAAPLLVGTGVDPSVPARSTKAWRAIGIGVCMPGWDYLFVAVGRRRAVVGMRVTDVGGGTRALRAKRGLGLTRVAGLGPSLRFRVKEPTLVSLEVQGSRWTGYALLRRAGN